MENVALALIALILPMTTLILSRRPTAPGAPSRSVETETEGIRDVGAQRAYGP